MSQPLLRTRLFVPQPRPDLVPRPQLMARLDDAVARGARLILVSAPAGYAKTTTIAQWVRHRRIEDRPVPTGWLSLAQEDNDPALFWSYVTAALQEIDPALGRGADAYLDASPFSARGLLIQLLNQAAELEEPAALVVDDYHLITSEEIHRQLTYLLEHLPPLLHLFLLTRADPPLPVARLHARGHALLLRAADLRFSEGETVTYLTESRALALSEEQVAALERRVEGWPAGLQMAAVALESVGHDPEEGAVEAFVRDFGGMQRYILDYLLEEILHRQPESLQAFLLQSSILDRFCAGLAAAVVDGTIGMSSIQAHDIVDTLESANLFVVPLDQQRRWYRYHHLFADLLRTRLRQRWPERLPGLHRRAAGWLAEQGMVSEAIDHALSAPDAGLAADLIEAHTDPLLWRGELRQLLRWVERLPAGTIADRPRLTVSHAWALTVAGEVDEAEERMRRAEAQLDQEQWAGSADGVRGHFDAFRAFHASTTGRYASGIRFAERALKRLPADARWARGVAYWAHGYAHRAQGHLEDAATSFAQTVRSGHARNDLLAIASSQYDLAMLQRLRGNLTRAAALLEEILALAAERDAENVGYLDRVEAGLARICYDQNRLAEAHRHIERSVELNQSWRNPNHDFRTQLVLAWIEFGTGRFAAALAALERAGEIARRAPVVPFLADEAAALRLRIWLWEGNLTAARQDARARGWNLAQWRAFSHSHDSTLLLALLRVELGRAELEDDRKAAGAVAQTLEELSEHYQPRPANRLHLEILLLHTLAAHQQGQPATARRILIDALRLARSHGQIRLVVDEGPAMRELLATVSPTVGDELRAYVRELLAAFPIQEAVQDDETAADPLAEPLTEREMDVLRLMARGLTNQQIADRLVIARGTVKAHAAKIYAKLDVHSRTRAAARARELGIL